MRRALTVAITALSSLCLPATSCRKNKEAKRLFADRHWHHTTGVSTSCYDMADTPKLLSINSKHTAADTVFAIKELGNGEIEFPGSHMYIYRIGDTDKYTYNKGNGTFNAAFYLFYAKKSNVIFAEREKVTTVKDTVQKTICNIVRLDQWTTY